jgi:isomerase DpgB
LASDGPDSSRSAADLIAAVNALCDRVEDNPDTGPVVLELVGPELEGLDAVWPEELSITIVNKWERTVRRLERLDAPTLAVAHGECSGPALDLLLATDYRIGTASTRLGLTRGSGMLWPGMALHRLVQQAGMARVRRLALFGQTLSAAEAAMVGLLDEVVEDVEAAIAAVTERVVELTGSELAVRRRLLLEAAVTSHEEAIGVHLSACDRTLRRSRGEQAEAAS